MYYENLQRLGGVASLAKEAMKASEALRASGAFPVREMASAQLLWEEQERQKRMFPVSLSDQIKDINEKIEAMSATAQMREMSEKVDALKAAAGISKMDKAIARLTEKAPYLSALEEAAKAQQQFSEMYNPLAPRMAEMVEDSQSIAKRVLGEINFAKLFDEASLGGLSGLASATAASQYFGHDSAALFADGTLFGAANSLAEQMNRYGLADVAGRLSDLDRSELDIEQLLRDLEGTSVTDAVEKKRLLAVEGFCEVIYNYLLTHSLLELYQRHPRITASFAIAFIILIDNIRDLVFQAAIGAMCSQVDVDILCHFKDDLQLKIEEMMEPYDAEPAPSEPETIDV